MFLKAREATGSLNVPTEANKDHNHRGASHKNKLQYMPLETKLIFLPLSEDFKVLLAFFCQTTLLHLNDLLHFLLHLRLKIKRERSLTSHHSIIYGQSMHWTDIKVMAEECITTIVCQKWIEHTICGSHAKEESPSHLDRVKRTWTAITHKPTCCSSKRFRSSRRRTVACWFLRWAASERYSSNSCFIFRFSNSNSANLVANS